MPIRRRQLLAATAVAVAAPSLGRAEPRIGAAAPAFTAPDTTGGAVALPALRGKVVVLEWTNDGCPFVGKWYRSGAMQALQREAASKGAVWVSVISSAPGEQGYVDAAGANALTQSRNAAPAHVVLDPDGRIGHLYKAETTPHIFIIRPDGALGYMGGADSISSTKVEDLARATPYAKQALEAIAAGGDAPNAVTRPYGCTVKYAA